MAVRVTDLVRHLHQPACPPDAALLERFVRHRDEAAFAALVARHGPMVLRVCRRAVADAHAADDAFQATFLVLARRATAVRKPAALAAWLHGVAHRVALKARASFARRALRETPLPEHGPCDPHPDPLEDLSARELLGLLDAEVRQLPEVYRLPVILCCLEGRTQEEAARLLGWSAGSVKGRLERGRARLHARLARRGLTLSAGLLAAEFSRSGASATVPVPLARRTLEAALAGVGNAVPASVATLAEGVVRGTLPGQVKLAALLLIALGVVAGAGWLLAHQPQAAKPDEPPPQPRAEALVRTDALGDPLPPGVLLRLGTVRLRHPGCLRSLAFSPDGKELISAGWDRVVRVWEPITGKELRHFAGPDKGFECMAVSGDGKILATGGLDGNVYLWDPATGKELRRFGGYPRQVAALAFSAKGDILATAGDQDKAVRLWNVNTGELLRKMGEHAEGVRTLAFSADGQIVASASWDKTARLWDVATGKELRPLMGEEGKVTCLAFSPDGHMIAGGEEHMISGGNEHTACLWDVTTGKPLRAFTGQHGGVQSVAFTPDGKLLATGGRDHTVRFWDPATGQELRNIHAHPDNVGVVAFSPDGKLLASGSAESSIHLWNVATGEPVGPSVGHGERIPSVTYSPDGKLLATSAWDRTLRLWDAATGKELRKWSPTQGSKRRLPTDEPMQLGRVLFSPDGQFIAALAHDSDSSNENVQVWEAATGKERWRFPGANMAFSPDGKLLACAGWGKTAGDAKPGVVIHLHDLTTGELVRELRGFQSMIAALTFSPDGKTLATTAQQHIGFSEPGEPVPDPNSVHLWDVPSGQPRLAFAGPAQGGSVNYSRDGKMMASLEFLGQTIGLWEAATGKERVKLEGHQEMVFSLSFGPDGRTLASGSMDGTVRLWDLPTGKEIARLQGHGGWVLSVAFAPDGKTLASSSTDTTVLVWDVASHVGRARPKPPSLQPAELEALWTDLAGDDAARAYRAIATLSAAPEQAVPLVRERLRPVTADDVRRLVRRIGDLDSEQFAVRQAAEEELMKNGAAGAESALREALAGNPPPEKRRRLEKIVEALERRPVSGEVLQGLRALEALEYAGTPEAVRVLEALSQGAAEARLMQEAKAGLERLSRRLTRP
jgi:RNA polymerase sigma factor (sigma-70 family)